MIDRARYDQFLAAFNAKDYDAVADFYFDPPRIEALRDLTREELDARGATGFFPILAGEVQEIRQFIFYTVKDGRIEKVEAALPPQL